MNVIVVVDEKWGIGKNNGLLFRLKEDMRFFREKTLGKVVAMGANTFRSLPKGALPDRINVVLDSDGTPHEGTVTFKDTESLLKELSKYDSDDVYIIGGAGFYKLMLPMCDRAYVTKVAADGEAELFFRNLDLDPDWTLVSQSQSVRDGDYDISFCLYRRKGTAAEKI